MKKICLATASRSEYERLGSLLKKFAIQPKYDLGIITIGPMATEDASNQIASDGFDLWGSIPLQKDYSTLVASHALGYYTKELSALVLRIAPDLILIPGDRYEQLASANVAVCQQTPLAHIWGGELTLGAMDDQIRHMITKASHLHFVANEDFARRVRQMGEETWRVCVSGSPALDVLAEIDYLDQKQLGKELGLDLSLPTVVATYHPETLSSMDLIQQIEGIITTIQTCDLQFVITYPNQDPGHEMIISRFHDLASSHPNRVRLFNSLGRQRYFSLLRHARLMLGNSSSGLVEAPIFKLPVVNIGRRQEGRLQGGNIVQADHSADSIRNALELAMVMSIENINSPYGDMHASDRIVTFLMETFDKYSRQDLLFKKFVDIPKGASF